MVYQLIQGGLLIVSARCICFQLLANAVQDVPDLSRAVLVSGCHGEQGSAVNVTVTDQLTAPLP